MRADKLDEDEMAKANREQKGESGKPARAGDRGAEAAEKQASKRYAQGPTPPIYAGLPGRGDKRPVPPPVQHQYAGAFALDKGDFQDSPGSGSPYTSGDLTLNLLNQNADVVVYYVKINDGDWMVIKPATISRTCDDADVQKCVEKARWKFLCQVKSGKPTKLYLAYSKGGGPPNKIAVLDEFTPDSSKQDIVASIPAA